MEVPYIDVNHRQRAYERARERFLTDDRISEHNKALVQRYLRDCALGKTVLGRAKKRIGPGRLSGNIHNLTTFILAVNKNLDEVVMEDMEEFILALQEDRIRSRGRVISGWKKFSPREGPLSPSTKHILKASIRKFYKWLKADNKSFPPLVAWFDMQRPRTVKPALTALEVEQLVDQASSTLQKAVVQVLFDSGFRIEEFLNVRLCHVRLVNYDPRDMTKECFFLRTPYSKTRPRTIPLPMPQSAKWLQYWLAVHPLKPRLRSDGMLAAADMTMPLFPLTANAVRHIIRRLGHRVLDKRVHPHMLRHSSIRYYRGLGLTPQELSARYGWELNSDMVREYDDIDGIDQAHAACVYHEHEARYLSSLKSSSHPTASIGERVLAAPDQSPRLLQVPRGTAEDDLHDERGRAD
jgi:site-specific recombinase XerD